MPADWAGKVIRCPRCRAEIGIAPTASRVLADPAIATLFGGADPASEFVLPGTNREARFDRLSERAVRARGDRVLMARFFAMFLLVVGAINFVPAIYEWHSWSIESADANLPRWTWLQIFVAALYAIYAIFVFQIADWSALKAVSAVLLVVAGMFGFVSASLTIGGSHSAVAVFLGLGSTMIRNATFWCIAMLLLAIVTSYLSGREAVNWQRVDKIFDHLVSQHLPG